MYTYDRTLTHISVDAYFLLLDIDWNIWPIQLILSLHLNNSDYENEADQQRLWKENEIKWTHKKIPIWFVKCLCISSKLDFICVLFIFSSIRFMTSSFLWDSCVFHLFNRLSIDLGHVAFKKNWYIFPLNFVLNREIIVDAPKLCGQISNHKIHAILILFEI